MQTPTQAMRRTGGFPYKWIVAMVVIFGLFMTILDSTIVNIAIPQLQNVFGADLTSVQWVLTAYTLVQGVVTPLTAFLALRFGQKRLYLFALAGFTVGSALCGFSLNLGMLIFFRMVQGAMGAFISPLAITLLERVSTERARNRHGCAGGSDPAGPGPWPHRGWLHRDLPGLAAHLLHQCADRHPRDLLGEHIPARGTGWNAHASGLPWLSMRVYRIGQPALWHIRFEY